MSELPSGWARASLDTVARVQLGRQRSPKNHVGPNMRPYVRAANITWDGLALDDIKEMHFSAAEAETFRLRSGDVLLSEASGSPSEVGKPALWGGQIDDCCFQNTVLRVRSDHVSTRYLLFFFEWLAFSGQFARSSRGVGIHHLGAQSLSQWELPLAPAEEQPRIVQAIEEQVSRIDAGVKALERAGRRLRALRYRGILALIAGTGTKVRLARTCDIRLGRQRSPKNHVGPNMVPYLRAANVTWAGLDLADVKEMNFTPSEVSIYALRSGDVLVAEASGSASEVGKPAIWTGSIPTCCFQNTLLRLRSEQLLPEYLYFVLLALARSGEFARASKGVGIHHLSKAGLADVMIEVPPLITQRDLVSSIREQQDYYAALDAAIQAALLRAHRLRSSVLAAAYAGRLVPQDPREQPASALLERIAAERAASNGLARTRARKLHPRQAVSA